MPNSWWRFVPLTTTRSGRSSPATAGWCTALLQPALPYATAHETSAADLTVHTFLQAWRNAEVFEPGREFGPWLANLAVRVVGAKDSGVGADATQR